MSLIGSWTKTRIYYHTDVQTSRKRSDQKGRGEVHHWSGDHCVNPGMDCELARSKGENTKQRIQEESLVQNKEGAEAPANRVSRFSGLYLFKPGIIAENGRHGTAVTRRIER